MKTTNKTTTKKINPIIVLLALPFLVALLGLILSFILCLVPFAALYFCINRICQVSEEKAQIKAKKELHLDKNYLTYLYKKRSVEEPKEVEKSSFALSDILSLLKN
mgnify:FL=1